MSELRDEFAKMAAQHWFDAPGDTTPANCAEFAYAFADAMMEARKPKAKPDDGPAIEARDGDAPFGMFYLGDQTVARYQRRDGAVLIEHDGAWRTFGSMAAARNYVKQTILQS